MTDIRQQVGVGFSLEPVWAMEPNAYERLRELVSTSTPERLSAATSLSTADKMNPGYEMRGGVAVIPFSGAVSKKSSIWARLFGDGGAVTSELTAQLAAAVADPNVSSILMVIDSPGGTVNGVSDAADAVAAANKIKPVCAYAEDMCASAAYWIGSQAGRFVGNATASVGSIGVFAAVPDVSRMAKNLGIEMNVVKSVPGKGAGTMGAPVTDAQLAEIQRSVDAIHAMFVGAVSRGRGRDMSAVADGRVYMGQNAVDLGLLDAVESISACIESMQPQPTETLATASINVEEILAMSEPTPTPAPVTEPTEDFKAKYEASIKELAEVRAAQDVAVTLAEKTNLIAAARAERKLTPAMTAVAESLAVEPLKAFLAALPASAPEGGSVSEPKSVPAGQPTPRHVSDHVGVALHAYRSDTAPAHMAAVEYLEKADASGKKISYYDAIVAVTRK